MPQPPLTPLSDYADSNGIGQPSMDTAARAQQLSSRAQYIQQVMAGAGGWKWSPDGSIMNGSITAAGSYDLGSFQLAPYDTNVASLPPGWSPPTIELWIHVSAAALTVAIYDNLFNLNLGSPIIAEGTFMAAGWYSVDLPSNTTSVNLKAVATGSPSVVIDSICFIANPDGGGPAKFPVRYLPWIAPNKPDDVDTVAAIDQALSWPLRQYPRHLASHNLTNGSVNTSDTGHFCYQVRRGPNPNAVDFAVYVNTDGASTATIKVYVNTGTGPMQADLSNAVGGTISGSSGSMVLTLAMSAGPAPLGSWVTFTVAESAFGASRVQEIDVRAHATSKPLIVYNICAWEEEYSPLTGADGTNGFLVNDYPTHQRTDLAPQQLIIPAPNDITSGQPIVGSYWETNGAAYQARWSDRRTMYANAVYLAMTKSQWLIFDQLCVNGNPIGDGATYGVNGITADFGPTAGSGSGLSAVARWKHRTKRGSATAQVFVSAKVLAANIPVDSPNVCFAVIVDNMTTYVFPAVSAAALWTEDSEWVPLGTYPVVEGATHDLQLIAGWQGPNGSGVGHTANPSLLIDGLAVVEQPPMSLSTGSAAAFFAQLPITTGVNIPASTGTGGGVNKTISCPATFTVRHARLWVQVTAPAGATIGHISFQFQAPDLTVIQFTCALVSGQLVGVSDDVLLDAGPTGGNLSSFIGKAANGTWYLNAADPFADTTLCTFDSFGLELT